MKLLDRLLGRKTPAPVAEQPARPPLPEWAQYASDRDGDFIEADPALAYAHYLALLEVPVAQATRYWIEVARRCATEQLKLLLRPAGVEFNRIRWTRRPEWRLAHFPEGQGEQRGSHEFRKHWLRLKREGKV